MTNPGDEIYFSGDFDYARSLEAQTVTDSAGWTRIAELERQRLNLQQQLLQALKERDTAVHGRKDSDRWADMFQQQRDAAEALIERMTPVVEAARAWLQQRRSADAFTRKPHAEEIRLADAVDHLDRTGQPDEQAEELNPA